MNIEWYEKFLNTKRAEQTILLATLEQTEKNIKVLGENLLDLEEALDVMNTVGVLAQNESKDIFEQLVTDALQYVFGTNYSFVIESSIARNQPETYLYVIQDDYKYLLKDADDNLGFGVVDVCSFVLRLACWAVKYPTTRNCFIIDEPCRNLDGEALIRFGDVVRNLSEMFDTQYIITTHRDNIMHLADKKFKVIKIDGISYVEVEE